MFSRRAVGQKCFNVQIRVRKKYLLWVVYKVAIRFYSATFIGLYTTYVIGFRYAVKMCNSHEKGKLYLTVHG